ncbi:MAG: C39 family peptidase [Bacteroidales bacterium]|nr:C39 family peptidase [Bacteroidales bacterium]
MHIITSVEFLRTIAGYDGSTSASSPSGSRPTNNSGSTNEYSSPLHVWGIGTPREIVLDAYGTGSDGEPPTINVLNDDFEKVLQEETNWCVFAVTEIIYNEFGAQIDQSDIANDFYNKIGVPENSNLPVRSLEFINEYFQSDDNYFVRDFKDIAKALKRGYPILASICVENSDVGHAIYIYGVDNLNGSYKFHYWDTGSKASYTISSFDLAIKIQFAYVVKDPF